MSFFPKLVAPLRKAFFSCLLPILLSSCTTTYLSLPGPDSQLPRLKALADASLTLRISFKSDAPPQTLYLGHQFLLGIIPFGNVAIEEPVHFIAQQLTTQAALRGVKLQIDNGNAENSRVLTVNIEELYAVGYDALLFRLPSAIVTLNGTLSDNSGKEIASEKATSSTVDQKLFAFSPELSSVFERAATEASEKLLAALNIGNKLN